MELFVGSELMLEIADVS